MIKNLIKKLSIILFSTLILCGCSKETSHTTGKYTYDIPANYHVVEDEASDDVVTSIVSDSDSEVYFYLFFYDSNLVASEDVVKVDTYTNALVYSSVSSSDFFYRIAKDENSSQYLIACRVDETDTATKEKLEAALDTIINSLVYNEE